MASAFSPAVIKHATAPLYIVVLGVHQPEDTDLSGNKISRAQRLEWNKVLAYHCTRLGVIAAGGFEDQVSDEMLRDNPAEAERLWRKRCEENFGCSSVRYNPVRYMRAMRDAIRDIPRGAVVVVYVPLVGFLGVGIAGESVDPHDTSDLLRALPGYSAQRKIQWIDGCEPHVANGEALCVRPDSKKWTEWNKDGFIPQSVVQPIDFDVYREILEMF
jgi:hypothetical protein